MLMPLIANNINTALKAQNIDAEHILQTNVLLAANVVQSSQNTENDRRVHNIQRDESQVKRHASMMTIPLSSKLHFQCRGSCTRTLPINSSIHRSQTLNLCHSTFKLFPQPCVFLSQ